MHRVLPGVAGRHAREVVLINKLILYMCCNNRRSKIRRLTMWHGSCLSQPNQFPLYSLLGLIIRATKYYVSFVLKYYYISQELELEVLMIKNHRSLMVKNLILCKRGVGRISAPQVTNISQGRLRESQFPHSVS